MKRSFLTAAALLMLGSLHIPPAAAADTGSVETVNLIDTEIAVLSNGSSYHLVPPTTALRGYVRIRLDAGTVGEAVWVTAWWRFGNAAALHNQWTGYRDYGYHKSFGSNGPNSWDETVLVGIPSIAFKDQVIDECNRLAERLREQNLSNAAIFSQDRTIDMGLHPALDYEMSGPSGNAIEEGASSFTTIKLVCKKWPGVTAPQVGDGLDSVPPVVESASLTLLERSGLSGVCKIILSGVIRTSKPNVALQFRYKDRAGHHSQVHSVSSDHAGIAMFSHQYDIANNPEGGESGAVYIDGVSHPFTSAEAGYDMDCVAPGASDFQALLAPSLEMQVVEVEKVMVGRQLCVSRLRLYGKITGRGPMSGYAGFVGDDFFISPPQPYEVEQDDIVLIGAERELDWSHDPQALEAAELTPAGQLKSQTIQLGFNITGESNAIVASLAKKPFTFTCVYPSVNPAAASDGGMTVAPRPQPAPAAPRSLALAPQAVPSGPQAGGQMAVLAALPDLTIRQAKAGQNRNRLRVVVVNDGSGPAPASRLNAVYRRSGRNVLRSVAVQPLKAGAQAVVVIDFGLPLGQARRIDLKIDDPDRVKEANEKNNRARFGG